jgi:hypothetical protein
MEHRKISNSKHQISGFQVSGKKNKNTETSVFVIWDFYSFFTGKATEL